MIQAIRQYWKNWTGLSLALIHAITLTGLILAKNPLPLPEPAAPPCPPEAFCFDVWENNFAGTSIIAGRLFHFSYENTLFQVLMLIDLPGQIAGLLLLLPVQSMSLSKLTTSYLVGLNWLVFGSIQWWLMGTMAAIKLKTKNRHTS
jgi:hypothetical protein